MKESVLLNTKHPESLQDITQTFMPSRIIGSEVFSKTGGMHLNWLQAKFATSCSRSPKKAAVVAACYRNLPYPPTCIHQEPHHQPLSLVGGSTRLKRDRVGRYFNQLCFLSGEATCRISEWTKGTTQADGLAQSTCASIVTCAKQALLYVTLAVSFPQMAVRICRHNFRKRVMTVADLLAKSCICIVSFF